MRRALLHWLKRHPVACFLLLGVSFFLFAVLTFNLAFLLQRNVELWLVAGWQAAMDGALQQSLELLLLGYGAMLAWVLFKLCEKLLLDRFCEDGGTGVEAGQSKAKEKS